MQLLSNPGHGDTEILARVRPSSRPFENSARACSMQHATSTPSQRSDDLRAALTYSWDDAESSIEEEYWE